MKRTCLVIDDEFHAIAELSELIKLHKALSITGSFLDINEAIAFLHAHGPVDIIFTDIDLPSISGIEAAEHLKQYCRYLIYVTAHRDYALEAFAAGADGYLIKPVSKLNFLKRVDEIVGKSALDLAGNHYEDNHMFIKGGLKNSFVKIRFGDIVFIEGMLNYIVIHAASSKEITYMGLKDIARKLEGSDNFIRINKSTIISMKYVEKVVGNTVYLSNELNFTVGEPYKSVFHERIMKHAITKR